MIRKISSLLSIMILTIFVTACAKKTEELTENIEILDPVVVSMMTNKGEIILELYPDKAPKSVENFINYVESGFYDGLVFHRVIPDFMIQGGGMDEELNLKQTNPPIESESKNGLKNEKGANAYARTKDPDSATSQFFINTKENKFLNYPGTDNHGYTVFGKVIDGMDVVEIIEKTPTGNKKGYQDVPVEDIIIQHVKVIEK